MTAVSFEFDGATAIPLPGADLAAADVDEWAADTALRFAVLHDFGHGHADVLARTVRGRRREHERARVRACGARVGAAATHPLELGARR